ncbi:MAG: cupin domain-containing protein [Gammaproteobacteria bacterium]|nr:cupin domain-containing protein [Gammaproteobacteria bacterium]
MGDINDWQDILEQRQFIQHNAEQTEYFFREGCYITELLNTPDDPGLSVAKVRVDPGQTTRWHQLEGIAERYLIVEGCGLVEVGDEPPREVSVDDVVVIPIGVRQRIGNVGDEALIFFAICTPRFVPEAYKDIEKDFQ